MKPKISTYSPFDYNDLLENAEFGFIDSRRGNTGGERRPIVIVVEDVLHNKFDGFEIDVYNNGIKISAEISFPKEGIDLESITTDVNKLICDWLVEQGHPYLLTAD